MQRTSQHPRIARKLFRECRWLKYEEKFTWVESRLDTSDAQVQVEPGKKRSYRSDAIRDLCKEGELDRALDVLRHMDRQGSVPSVPTYSSLLKACASRRALPQAKQVCTNLAKHGLDSTRFLGEYLVNTLVKCGGLADALQVFRNLRHRTVFSWTAMISGYSMRGQSTEALRMYRCMQNEGVLPNTYTVVSLLKACGSIPDLKEGKRIHAAAVKYDCADDVFVGTCLVDMYAKCGSIVDSRNAFDGLAERNVVSWNTIINAYMENGDAEMVLQLYMQMQEEGVNSDERTLVSVLQACGALAEEEDDTILDRELTKLQSLNVGCINLGKTVHAEAYSRGYTYDVFIGSTLVSMYSKCGSIVDAQRVFGGLAERNVVAWTAMLVAYAQQGRGDKSLQLFEQMLEEGISPNVCTFASALQACGILAEKEENVVVDGRYMKLTCLEKGKAIHASAWRKGFDSDVFVSSTLISMYGKCGDILHAEYVFHGLLEQNLVPWNALFAMYVQHSNVEKVLQLYEQMQEVCVSPDGATFVSVLQSCGMLAENEDDTVLDGVPTKLESLEKGKAIHAHAWTKGYNSHVLIGNTLISMYGKCGSIMDAQNVFDGLSHRNVVTWTALLAAFAQLGEFEKVLKTFKRMKKEGVNPDDITLVCVLHMCSNTGGLDVCRQIHCDLVASGCHLSPLLANTLIDSFGRCSSMVDAETVFGALSKPDVVSWTALIAGYAREGNCGATLQRFEDMQLAGIKPNGITFLTILAACSHAGLVAKGIQYFESMSRDHAITPRIEHFVSIVDLLGRAGFFTSVEDLLLTMPMQPNLAMWLCLLGACRKHGEVILGKRAFDSAVLLQPKHAAAYVLMSSIYADAGLGNCAKELHASRQNQCAWKKPGQSWIDHQQKVHYFVVGDQDHLEQEQVYNMLGKVSLELEVGHLQVCTGFCQVR